MNFPALTENYYYFLYGIGAGVMLTLIVALLLSLVYRLFTGRATKEQKVRVAEIKRQAGERKAQIDKEAKEAAEELNKLTEMTYNPPKAAPKQPAANSPKTTVSATTDAPVVTVGRRGNHGGR
jgi:hypothetical protein